MQMRAAQKIYTLQPSFALKIALKIVPCNIALRVKHGHIQPDIQNQIFQNSISPGSFPALPQPSVKTTWNEIVSHPVFFPIDKNAF